MSRPTVRTDIVPLPVWSLRPKHKMDQDISATVAKRERQGYELIGIERRPGHASLAFRMRP